MRTCVLIPSYNVEAAIGGIVRDVKKRGLEAIVIDDGSSDNTGKVAAENGATVRRHKKNLGKGAALKEGFGYILEATNYDSVIIMDGDGQHNPAEIENFIAHAKSHDDDIIVGNRMKASHDMPFVRRATNKIMSYFLSAMCRQAIPDTQCGFRLIRRRVLKSITLESDKYDLESEILIKASRKRFKIASVPIEVIYRDEQSSIHPVKDTIRFIALVLRLYSPRPFGEMPTNAGISPKGRGKKIIMDFTKSRDRMVEEQLIPRGISDKRVLEAFRSVERHKFVPSEFRDSAYDDHPLPIGASQTISQPYMVALMTQCLDLKGGEKILEIGAGSGYQAAILSGLAKEVYTVERIPSLANKAEETLKKLGYNNVKVGISDGTLGWPEHAPYDGIIVTAAAPKVPSAYIEQLKVGGKLVIPEGSMFSQVLTVAEKKAEGTERTEICGCVFVPLLGKDGWKE